jgi:hypothetical protein
MSGLRHLVRARRAILTICLAVLLPAVPAQAVPQRALGAYLFMAGLMASTQLQTESAGSLAPTFLRPHVYGEASSIPLTWAVPGAFVAGLALQGAWKSFFVSEIRGGKLDGAVLNFGVSLADFAAQAAIRNDKNFLPAAAIAWRFGLGATTRYFVGRAWDPVREFNVRIPPGFQLAPVSGLLPTWLAHQTMGAAMELGAIGLTHGVTHALLSTTPALAESKETYYRNYPTLFDLIMEDYFVTMAGHVAVAVCALGMTYANPVAAGSLSRRMPCHLLRLGARSGVRALFTYAAFPRGADWQGEFMANEKYLLAHDFVVSLFEHRWWNTRRAAYARYEFEPLDYPMQWQGAPDELAPLY